MLKLLIAKLTTIALLLTEGVPKSRLYGLTTIVRCDVHCGICVMQSLCLSPFVSHDPISCQNS